MMVSRVPDLAPQTLPPLVATMDRRVGLLGFEVRQATPMRLAGGAPAIAGVVVIALF